MSARAEGYDRRIGNELVPSLHRVTAVAVPKRDERPPVDLDAEHLVLTFLAVRVGDRKGESGLRTDVERSQDRLTRREVESQTG